MSRLCQLLKHSTYPAIRSSGMSAKSRFHDVNLITVVLCYLTILTCETTMIPLSRF